MAANDIQVGGDHYRKVPGEQHWDRLVRLYGLPASRCYFIGNITGYVERYQYKGGIQDLEKARHYLDKLIELEKAYEESLATLTCTGCGGRGYCCCAAGLNELHQEAGDEYDT
jgi:hypothetical protein